MNMSHRTSALEVQPAVRRYVPGGPMAHMIWMSTRLMVAQSLVSYQFQWPSHWRSSSTGGWAPYVSLAGMLTSSTNTTWRHGSRYRLRGTHPSGTHPSGTHPNAGSVPLECKRRAESTVQRIFKEIQLQKLK